MHNMRDYIKPEFEFVELKCEPIANEDDIIMGEESGLYDDSDL